MLCSRLGISVGRVNQMFCRRQAGFPSCTAASRLCEVVFSFNNVGVVRGKAEVTGEGWVDIHDQ